MPNHQFKLGDRVRYRSGRTQYKGIGTAQPTVSDPECFWVKFDNGHIGLFYWPGDFVLLSVVDQLAALAGGSA